jgi:prepilin-type N-terminal cleavage/methylation domain-containing protein
MRQNSEKGLTLVELIISLTIMGIIATASIPLLSSTLEVYSSGTDRSRLYHEGLMAMERMTAGVKKTTFLTVPNGHSPTRDILVFSRLVNSDNDFYFGDPLFPRIDEDTNEYFSFGGWGVQGVDEDGDGVVDEGNWKDDDEDGLEQEEIFDGLDNDGDGSIDEDVKGDSTSDALPGIEGIDDDGDGEVDEMPNPNYKNDDDEDGETDEEEIHFAVYTYNASANTLTEIHSDPFNGIYNPAPKVVLSDHVTNFEAFFEAPERIRITLELTNDNGESVTFTEYVCPRNVYQRNGKRVR